MKKIFFLSIIILFSIPFTSFSQWTQTAGPNGTNVLSICIDGNNIWIGTSNGAFLSTNNGNTWVNRSNGINGYINSIAVNGGYVFAFYGNLVYCSSDMGMTWISCSNGLPGSYSWENLYTINNIVLCAGSNYGIYLTSNNGSNWIAANGSPTAARSIYNFKGILFAANGSNVYKSSDNGYNWIMANNGLGSAVYYGFTSINANLFAVASNKVYVSIDSGASWNIRSTALTNINCITSQGSNLFVGEYNNSGNSNGIYKSTDLGITWFQINNGLYTLQINIIAPNGIYLFAGANSYAGIFVSSNQGSSWVPKNSYFTNVPITDLYIFGNNIYAATSGLDINVTTNNGDNWTMLYPALPSITFNSVAVTGSYIFGGAYGYIYMSSDNGLNWSIVYTGNCYSLAINNNIIFAGMNSSILRSSDFGNTWFPTSSPSVYSFACSGDTLFAGTGNSQILYSHDNGYIWNVIMTGSYGTVKGLAYTNNTIFAGTSTGGVLKSTNLGSTWTLCNNGLISTAVSHIITYQQYVFTASDNVYYSSDNGASWSIVSYGLYGKTPTRLAINTPYIFAGTNGYSVWRRPITEIVGINQRSENIPVSFKLYQNYPNPFNPVTKIKFDIPEVRDQITEVRLVIFNILGKEITTLVNEKLQPGNYEFKWDGSNYPSGVYVYQLEIRDPETSSGLYFSETKKMILIK